LSYWKYKLRRQPASPERAGLREPRKTASTARFLRVVPVDADSVASAACFEIVVGIRTVVRVPNDFDEPALIRLVRVLGGI
jgi:hypothetical protein